MKNGHFLLGVLLFLFMLSACGGDKGSYIVDFDIKNIGTNPVYAVHKSYTGNIRIDTVWPKNNFFRVKGDADSLSRIDLYSIQYNRLISLYIKNGYHIEIEGDAKHLSSAKIKDGGINNDIADFYRKHSGTIKTLDSLLQKLSFISPEKTKEYNTIKVRTDSLLLQISKQVAEYAEQNKRSSATVALIAENMLIPHNIFLCDSIMKTLSSKAKRDNPIARREIESFLRDSYDATSATLFKPFKLKNEKDSTIYIDSLHGKPTILHFWSAELLKNSANNSWLNDATFYFADSTINVISIAFDIDTAIWKQNLRNNPYRGIKLIEPKGFNSDIAQNYGIRKLPDNIIIDRNGQISGRNLKSSEMAALLKKISETPIANPDSIPN